MIIREDIEKIKKDGAIEKLSRSIGDVLFEARRCTEDAQRENYKHFDTLTNKVISLLQDARTLFAEMKNEEVGKLWWTSVIGAKRK